jgi:hypothetical protein
VINAAKKLLSLGLFFFCITGPGYGDAWELMASYPTPGSNPWGYWSGGPEAGYVVMDGPDPHIYFYWWIRSSIISSFPAPGGPGAWGIYYFASTFYITNNRTSWIYETTKQGSVVSSFRCPFDGPADLDFNWFFPVGLLVAIPDRNMLVVLNRTTGSLVGTFAGPGQRPTGCCGYAHRYVADATTHAVYENGVPVITGIQTPVGLAETISTAPPYDIKLYVIDDATDYYYYYARTSGDIGPASLGRVKALFQ